MGLVSLSLTTPQNMGFLPSTLLLQNFLVLFNSTLRPQECMPIGVCQPHLPKSNGLRFPQVQHSIFFWDLCLQPTTSKCTRVTFPSASRPNTCMWAHSLSLPTPKYIGYISLSFVTQNIQFFPLSLKTPKIDGFSFPSLSSPKYMGFVSFSYLTHKYKGYVSLSRVTQ